MPPPDGLMKRRQTELEKYQKLQKEYQKSLNARGKLDAQLTENTLVKEELNKLEPDAKVFKLIGPALVKQDLEEAKQTVSKRIEYITGELKRHEILMKDVDSKMDTHRETLSKLQHQIQQAEVKAAARS